jgi:hypothetical protein
MKVYWGNGDTDPLILTLALDGGEWSASRPDRFNPRERAPGTHWIGGWLGPRSVLDAVVKRKTQAPCSSESSLFNFTDFSALIIPSFNQAYT